MADSQRSHERHESPAKFFSRRRLLQASSLGFLGLNLSRALEAAAAEASRAPGSRPASKVKSCILLFYYGGPSHLDTWDMKPGAPREVRGEFSPIATRVPGIQIGEHLPRCAGVMDKVAVIRSMHHPMRNHNSAAVEALCGRSPLKGDLELLADDSNSFPCYGAGLSYLDSGARDVPNHVALPHVMHNVVVLPGQNAGFLGAAFNPLQVAHDPNDPAFRIAELELPVEMPLSRLHDRQSLISALDAPARRAETHARWGIMSNCQQRAFDLLRSEKVRRAVLMDQEGAASRDRYGRNRLGQSLLLARRLVEAGVRFVNVNDKIHNGQEANWDSHQNNFGRLKNDLLPQADQAFSALIEDLGVRGLLDSTLVVALGEFGRTPKVNGQAGRDHWPDCFSVVLAGGGVKGGSVYGSSDGIGAYPDADPVTPGDLAATIFWRFGLDPRTEVRDVTGRPFKVAEGEPLRELFES